MPLKCPKVLPYCQGRGQARPTNFMDFHDSFDLIGSAAIALAAQSGALASIQRARQHDPGFGAGFGVFEQIAQIGAPQCQQG